MPYRLWRPQDAGSPIDPRVARSRAKIFEAVLEELASSGYQSLSIEGVAARAGVGKTTIYRHWPTKARLVTEAVHDHKEDIPLPETGNLRDDLVSMLGTLAERLATVERARIMPAMILAAEVDPELEELHHAFVAQRRRPLIRVLERAVERGELPVDVDVEIAADLLAGPLFYRRFITRDPVSSALAETLVDTLLPQLATLDRGVGRRPGGRHGGRRGNMRGAAKTASSHRRTGPS